MRAIIDHGHEYELLTLDGAERQFIRFVKRCGGDALKFPGNKGKHSGTTAQSLARVLHSRVSFLNSQHHCAENLEALHDLRHFNWLLESRAARRHGRKYTLDFHEAIDAPMCGICGHTVCEHR